MQNNNGKRYTQSGTDIEEVKRQNAQAGPAQPFGTNPQKVREEIAQEAGPFNQPAAPSQSFSNPLAGTPSATNPQKVREEIAQEAGPFNQPAAPSQPSQSYSNPLAGAPYRTNPQKVREEIAEEAGLFDQPFSNQPAAGKTVAGTDIEEVRRQNQQAEQGKNKF